MQTATHLETRTRRRVHRTTAADSKLRGKGRGPFSRYKDEEAEAVRRPQVKENAALRQLRTAWRNYRFNADHMSELYEEALGIIIGIRYNAKDVENFSIALAEFQDSDFFDAKAGLFLSALINKCEENDFVVHTEHLDKLVRGLGCRNTKNIVVNGNLGHTTGAYMEQGSILVKGHVYHGLGSNMQGGIITVLGNAGINIGYCSSAGSIDIHGANIGGIGIAAECKVFSKGVQIYPKPS